MRALAVSSDKRDRQGIPTLKEQGVNVELANWRGIFGAPGITKAQQARAGQGASRRPSKSKAWEETLKKQDWTDYLPRRATRTAPSSHAENKRIGDILGELNLGKK